MILILLQNLVAQRIHPFKQHNSLLHKHYLLSWISPGIDVLSFFVDMHVHACSEIF